MEANSLKELFQGLMPPGSAILQGTVTKDDPLEITAANDSKLVISGEQLIVPWHLTDYTTHADYTMGDKGDLRDETYTKMDGGHQHVDSRGGSTTIVKHKLILTKKDCEEKLNAYKMTLKVYNHLQKDDLVYLLSINNGKLYYVLDRVAGQVAGKDI